MKVKGSKNLVRVKLSDLNRMFKEDALIPVSTVFARQNMLNGVIKEDAVEKEGPTEVTLEEVNFDD